MKLYNIYCIKCIMEFQIKVVRVNSFVIGIPHFFYYTIPHELTDLTDVDTELYFIEGATILLELFQCFVIVFLIR